jgi:dipeptide transport system permease protein
MLAFILRRLALVIPTFIGITIAAFGFIRLLPGDPVRKEVVGYKMDATAHHFFHKVDLVQK